MPEPVNPIRDTDDEARALARDLILRADTAALAVIDPTTGDPFVSRVAVGVVSGSVATLVSALSLHTRALRANPRCCLLFGEPGDRGDPLNHPRLSVTATARFLARGDADHDAVRCAWLASHPKSKLYVDFEDFAFAVFSPVYASLNGGFARAYALGPKDLTLP